MNEDKENRKESVSSVEGNRRDSLFEFSSENGGEPRSSVYAKI